MQTALSVAQVRALYESLASSSAAFINELNEVLERLMTDEMWEGLTEEVLFPLSDDNYLVLPRQFVAVLGYTLNNVPRPIFGTFHQYIELGMGWRDPDTMPTMGLIDAGRVVAQEEISGTATLRVKPTLAVDAGKVIRFFGLDQNSQPIYTQPTGVDGITLTTAVPFSDTTQQFTALTGIQCLTDMVGRWTLWQVVAGQETQIGTYEPGESYPNYRRYKIGTRTDEAVVRCYCRRQFVKVAAETDWVYPGNLAAIKLGLKALQLEDANKIASDSTPNADNMWERAYSELDKELAVFRGGALPSIRMIGGNYPQYPYLVN